ncbi:MAG: acyl carrier protein, partial [Chloroflexota bacterium]
MSHKAYVVQKLTELLTDLSGVTIPPEDRNKQFLELGFDSLILTQVSAALKKKLKVNIRFRRLLEDVSTLELLAEYCAEKIAPVSSDQSTVNSDQSAGAAFPSALVTGNQTPMALNQMSSLQSGTGNWSQDAAYSNPSAFPTETVKRQVVVEKSRPQAPQSADGDEINKVRFGPYKPIQKGEKGGLTPQQAEYLEELINKLIAKTPSSKRVAQENRDV